MKVAVGQRLASTVCDTEVIVLKTTGAEVALRCGGAAMTDAGGDAAHAGPGVTPDGDGTLVGKRYVDPGQSVELLCTKPGAGALSIGDEPLVIKAANALPSSD
ncbi:hypothetical protein SAMN05443575_3176 [Jatrophihabitans endophyticus]|uniref:Uncharacterized protein n=1 Tax=Jatrophihabitans endophyticus TaxID=1206085 RepID=A0A1M5PRP0_9ACTN|nr:hypothetical protein [Jatrophihabitans endophyticus]SHH04537.1 hypothetical protein SAMN05443575_3176 [Jatrophihabitans endophyticus]